MSAATHVVFTIAGTACALDREEVRKVLPLPALTRPPGTPPVMEGVLDLAGVAVPVLRLDRLFGLPDSPPDPYRHLVLLRDRTHPLAILVDRVIDVIRLPSDEPAALHESESFNGCVLGAVSLDGRPINLLDAQRLLAERERQCLAEFQALEQRRLESFRAPS